MFLDATHLVTTDLGFDLMRFWRISEEGLDLEYELVMPAGSGPRHLARLPDGRILLVTEYSVEVVSAVEIHDGSGRFRIEARVGALFEGSRPGDTGANITVTPDGRKVHVGVRGSDRIAVLQVGADGAIHPVADVPSGGRTPRHHLIVGDYLYVAHQESGEITTHVLDPTTGVPIAVTSRIDSGSPTAIVLQDSYVK